MEEGKKAPLALYLMGREASVLTVGMFTGHILTCPQELLFFF